MPISIPYTPTELKFNAVEPLTTGPQHPPLPGPGVDTIGAVKLGQIPSATTVTVGVANIVGNCFALDTVSLLEWVFETVDGGELPPGWKGPPPRVRVLEVVDTFDGSQPIPVTAGQYLLASVKYTAPYADGTFTGTLNITSGDWIPIAVPLSLYPALVTADVISPTPIAVQQGNSSTFLIRLQSALGPAVDVNNQMSPADHTGLYVSSLTAEPVHLEPKTKANVVFSIAASQEAPLGPTTVGLRKSDFRTTIVVVPTNVVPAEVMPGTDSSIVWEETTDYSIRVNQELNAWHAGHVNDVLLRADGIFVAADTGGIWGIDTNQPGAPAGCVTDDLDRVNVNCLAFGPDSPLQIYAGCDDPGGLLLGGFASWRQIVMVDDTGAPLSTGTVFRIAVLKARRAIVLATGTGIYWSDIPGPGRYIFHRVASLPDGGYSGMAVGPNESVVVSMWGDGTQGGIFVGTFSPSDLIFTPAMLNGDVSAMKMGRTSLAACASTPNVMYAVAGGLDNRIYRILRSDSGGSAWQAVPNTALRVVPNKTNPLAPDAAENDMAGSTGWYTNCIGVGANDSNLVGIGWANGPWLSTDAGTQQGESHWTLRYEQDGGGKNDNVHADIHGILFDPGDPAGRTIYVACDGGLMRTFDAAGDNGYESILNAHLRNLQFYSAAAEFTSQLQTGGISASPTDAGLIAGPTQDNGNLYCALDGDQPNAWVRLEGGDGVQMRFLSNGLLLDISPNDTKARLSRWDGTQFADRAVVPVRRPGSDALISRGDIAAVEVPHYRHQETDQLMYAVTATENVIGQRKNLYGLFSDGNISSAQWDLIATLQIDDDDAILCVASLRGDQVFAGTRKGRIFSLAPFQTPFELTVTPSDRGPVHQIVVVRDALAFALYDGTATKAILQSDFFSWDPLGSNSNVARGIGLAPGGEPFTALAIDRVASPPTLFAATDSRVFVSRDEGDTWLLATTGLPKRAHCTSLATGALRKNGGRYLYLGTYGRSVWQARLG